MQDGCTMRLNSAAMRSSLQCGLHHGVPLGSVVCSAVNKLAVQDAASPQRAGLHHQAGHGGADGAGRGLCARCRICWTPHLGLAQPKVQVNNCRRILCAGTQWPTLMQGAWCWY